MVADTNNYTVAGVLWFTGYSSSSDDFLLMMEFHIARHSRVVASSSFEPSYVAPPNGHVHHILIRDSYHFWPQSPTSPELREVDQILIDFPHLRAQGYSSNELQEFSKLFVGFSNLLTVTLEPKFSDTDPEVGNSNLKMPIEKIWMGEGRDAAGGPSNGVGDIDAGQLGT